MSNYAELREEFRVFKETGTCRCKTLAHRLVGDGCDICNPALAISMRDESIAELEKELLDGSPKEGEE